MEAGTADFGTVMNQTFAFDSAALMALAVGTGWFKSTCTVQQPSGTYVNGVRNGAWTDVTGLVGIQCMDAPLGFGPNIQSAEQKAAAEVASMGVRHVLLNGYYAQLDGLNWGLIGWRAVVDGVAYDIRAAERDSQFSQTRLKLELVTV